MTGPLTDALGSLHLAGEEPICAEATNRDWWISDDHEQRTLAGRLCRLCPIADACTAEALDFGAVAGVWGGHDFHGSSPDSRAALARELGITTTTTGGRHDR
ncbi:WhiB family transcriptional regulator [Propionibacteriaceae bacterium Y1923]